MRSKDMGEIMKEIKVGNKVRLSKEGKEACRFHIESGECDTCPIKCEIVTVMRVEKIEDDNYYLTKDGEPLCEAIPRCELELIKNVWIKL